jgi:hypothetical protein
MHRKIGAKLLLKEGQLANKVDKSPRPFKNSSCLLPVSSEVCMGKGFGDEA